MDTESGPKGLIGRRSFFSSPIAVTKFHGEPRQICVKYKEWENVANIALYLGNGTGREGPKFAGRSP